MAGVQYILDTVVQALQANPDRKFVYADMSEWGAVHCVRAGALHAGGGHYSFRVLACLCGAAHTSASSKIKTQGRR